MIKVLFVDDEGVFIRPYIDALSKVYSVGYAKEAGEVPGRFGREEDVGIIVLDIMMPTPIDVDSDSTKNGMMTGIWVLEQIRELLISRNVPVLVLTNRGKPDVIFAVEELDFPAGLVEVYSKNDVIPPKKLQVLVDSLLGKWPKQQKDKKN